MAWLSEQMVCLSKLAGKEGWKITEKPLFQDNPRLLFSFLKYAEFINSKKLPKAIINRVMISEMTSMALSLGNLTPIYSSRYRYYSYAASVLVDSNQSNLNRILLPISSLSINLDNIIEVLSPAQFLILFTTHREIMNAQPEIIHSDDKDFLERFNRLIILNDILM